MVQPMHGLGSWWKRCGACQECAEILPPAPVGGHPGLFQHDRVVVVLMQYAERLTHGALLCEFGDEINVLGDKAVSFRDKTKTKTMKQFLHSALNAVVLALFAVTAVAQGPAKAKVKAPKEKPVRVCHTMGNLDRLMHEYPKMERNMALIERHTQEFVRELQKSSANRAESQVMVTIPVVFHVLYANESQNISDAQIQSQLDILNEDFRRLNADQDDAWAQAADTQIEFCLAAQDPEGNESNGILRVPTTVGTFGTNDAMKFTSQGGSDAWPASEYLNFWVCNLGSSLLGYGVLLCLRHCCSSLGCGFLPRLRHRFLHYSGLLGCGFPLRLRHCCSFLGCDFLPRLHRYWCLLGCCFPPRLRNCCCRSLLG